MINAAIVGAGDWGQRLVASVQGQSDCIRFSGVVSRTPDRIAAFAALHELTVYSDLQRALEDPGIDADNDRGWLGQQVFVFRRFVGALLPRRFRIA